MKFGKDFALKPVDSGNPPAPGQASSPVTDIAYNTEKADLTQSELPKSGDGPSPQWKAAAINLAHSKCIKLADNLKEALIRRQNGERVMTIRELSILARSEKDAGCDFLWAALLLKGGLIFISEDDWASEEDVFGLRIRYNMGILWRNQRRSSDTLERVKAGDELLAELPKKMEDLLLPMYQDEISNGFPEELLKPEWGKRQMFSHRQAKAKFHGAAK